jgi:hypothetical protein
VTTSESLLLYVFAILYLAVPIFLNSFLGSRPVFGSFRRFQNRGTEAFAIIPPFEFLHPREPMILDRSSISAEAPRSREEDVAARRD